MTSAANIPQLLLLLPSGEIRVPLDRSTTSLGSDPGCAISLSRLGLAAFHAIIQRDAGAFEIFSLDSEAGVRVNGNVVQAAGLKPGDQLELGRLRAVFLAATTERAEILPFAPEDRPAPRPDRAARPDPKEAPDAVEEREPPAWRRLLAGFGRAVSVIPRKHAVADDLTDNQEEALEALGKGEIHFHSRTHYSHPTFAEEVVDGLKTTPWVLLSAVAHAILLLLIDVFTTLPPPRREPVPVTASMADSVEMDDEEVHEVQDAEISVEDPDDAFDDPDVEEPVDLPDEPMDQGDGDSEDEPGEEEGPFAVGTDTGSSLGDGLRGMGDFGKGGSSQLRELTGRLRASGLDIVFVVDSTGSMGEVLQDARSRIGKMITVLGQMVPSFRLGLVTYRDVGDLYVTRSVQLTPYRYEVVRFLEDIRADGGGDHPEDVLSGLQAAIKQMPWSKKARRLVILVGDAPPHKRDESRLRALVRYFAGKKGTLHTIFTPHESRGPQSAQRSFKSLAKIGHGSYVQLAQNEEILLRILEVVFGKKYQRDMKSELARVLGRGSGRRFERLVKRSKPDDITRRINRARLPDELVEELSTEPRAEFLPALLTLLGDGKARMGARWAAAVLIRRLVRGTAHNPTLEALADELRPDRPAKDLRRAITAFSRLAATAGLPVKPGK